jgi:prepilin-type N-terminal cleavage/methylation domain-containing protein
MKRGFTLIELLVVIAIIGILSSVVLASLNSARGKANDAKIRSDMHQLSVALQLYYDKHGSFPTNPSPGGAVEITSALPALVTEGFIGSLPTSPNASFPYKYYLYAGSFASTAGAMVATEFTSTDPSTGYAGSCRPFAANTNWCDASSNTYYCLCHPY